MRSLDDLYPALRRGDIDAVRAGATGGPLAVTARGGGVTKEVALYSLRSLAGSDGDSDVVKAAQRECLDHIMSAYQVKDFSRSEVDGETAVQAAASTGRLDLVQQVLAVCPEIGLGSYSSDTIFSTLAKLDNAAPIAQAIFDHPDLKVIGGAPSGPAPLMAYLLQEAIVHSNVGLVRWLQDRGVSVVGEIPVHMSHRFSFDSGSDEQTAYPIHFAASHEMVELLESMGATIHAVDPSVTAGQNALWPAVRNGALDHLRYLIKRGLPVDHLDALGRTVLHAAAERATASIIRALVAVGANVNARSFDGVTPIMRAIESGQNATRLAELLKHGADMFERDAEGNHRAFLLSQAQPVKVAAEHILRLAGQKVHIDPADVSDFCANLIATNRVYAKLAEAEKLSAQSFEIMRRQSAMIQGLKASKEALIASEKELNAANTELTAENGRLSVTVLRLQTTLSTKQKEFTNIVDNQNVMISRLLNLPPKADDMS
jgi:hypothetical protein